MRHVAKQISNVDLISQKQSPLILVICGIYKCKEDYCCEGGCWEGINDILRAILRDIK